MNVSFIYVVVRLDQLFCFGQFPYESASPIVRSKLYHLLKLSRIN